MEYGLVIQQGYDEAKEISVILSYDTQKVTRNDFFRTHVKDYRPLSGIVKEFETVITPSYSIGNDDKVCMFFSDIDKYDLVKTLLRYFSFSDPSQEMIQ